jgi:hypothetical protein
MNIIVSSSAEFIANPQALMREIHAGNTVFLSDVGYTIGPSPESVVEDINEAEDMAALRTDVTGVDNTVFVSPKGYAPHAARIKIAVDPSHSLDPTAKKASMAIHDYSTIGAYLPPHIVEQAKQFIDRNRDALLRYWNHEIDTRELLSQIKPP